MKLVIIDSGVNPPDDQLRYQLIVVFKFNTVSKWRLQGVAILDQLINQDLEILRNNVATSSTSIHVTM